MLKLQNIKSFSSSCPINHELVVDHSQLTAHCVCSHNKQCSVDNSKQDILIIEILLWIIIQFIILIFVIVRTMEEQREIKGTKMAEELLDVVY